MTSPTQQNCPVVGTTNTTLPPSHPDINLSQPGQTCPVVGATTDHHSHVLHKHPHMPSDTTGTGHLPTVADGHVAADDASACPHLTRQTVNEDKSRAMDDEVCPVVGTATTVLPPEHPVIADGSKPDGAVCPVTKATVKHHRERVHGHPSVAGAREGAVCPVTGQAGVRA